ncbi:DegT/DnrJ/EryC1/StrS family aminotransferase [Candidatus Nitrospira bockiana]
MSTQTLTSVPIIRPTLPPLENIVDLLADQWALGTVTLGPVVKAFEEEVCRQIGVRHAVALSSCTAGLMLAVQALGLPRGSEVIVPSFTFAATAQALVWNGLVPVFCDCLPGTCTLDPDDVERNLSAKTSAICGVTIFGLPPDVDSLVAIGERRGVPVFFDSAQGLGATYKGKPLGGLGSAEIFSLSPTKVVTAIEGGLFTTNHGDLADRVRAMRDYGKDPITGEGMLHLGLSARMSELHAAVGLLSVRRIDDLVKERLVRIHLYRERLGSLRGCTVQSLPADRTTSGNYFVIFISDRAKQTRDQVYTALKDVGIQTKRYFHPPVHRQDMFQDFPMRLSDRLAQTNTAAREGLALPLYSHMTLTDIDTVCEKIRAILA